MCYILILIQTGQKNLFKIQIIQNKKGDFYMKSCWIKMFLKSLKFYFVWTDKHKCCDSYYDSALTELLPSHTDYTNNTTNIFLGRHCNKVFVLEFSLEQTWLFLVNKPIFSSNWS